MGPFDDLIPEHPNVDKIIGVESAGNPNAKNSRSSAEGLGQFIDGTWREFIQEQRPDLLTSGQDIYALKRDPQLSREATNWYARKNEDYLGSRGLPTDSGSVYLAHFAGPAGAEKLLTASPEASAADILGGDVVRANPFLAGMSAGDVQNWARRKMGEGGETQVAQAGPFDDLIPQTAQQPGPFDDLIPQVAPAEPPSGQQERPPEGEAGGAAPAGEGIGQPPPAVAETKPEDEGGAFDWFWRSKYRWQTKNLMLEVLNNRKDTATAAQEFKELVDLQSAIPERQAYTEGAKAMARYEKGLAPEYEGVRGWFKFFYDHPSYALESVAESGFQTGEAVIVGGAGAIVGAPLGPAGMATGMALGVGASSGVTEGVAKYMEALQEEGIDVTSEESLAGAFANPELLAKVRTKAIAKGATVGFFDGFTSLLGARGVGKPIAESIGKVIGSEAAKKGATRKAVEESAAELFFLEAPGGMAGEAFGELASEGEIANPLSVLMEGFGEIALGGPQVAIQTMIAKEGREAAVADVKRIKEVLTAITNVPAYEDAVLEGRNWFGFVERSFDTEDAPARQALKYSDGKVYEGNTMTEVYDAAAADGKDTGDLSAELGWMVGGKFTTKAPAGPARSRVFRDYTQAEEEMGKSDPRDGRLVAASEDDITATFDDAKVQAGHTNKPNMDPPALRFVRPESQQQAQESWNAFVASGKRSDYRKAVAEGLRVTPKDTQGRAEFVGDIASTEILPKSELPLRKDTFSVRVPDPQTGQMPKYGFTYNAPLDISKILQDDRFVVRLTPNSVANLRRAVRRTELAPTLLEVKDPVWESVIANQGWDSFLDSLGKMSDTELSEVFHDGKVKLRPSLAWNSRMIGLGDSISVDSRLPEAEAKAALKAHEAIIPSHTIGVDTVEQAPSLPGINPGGTYDITTTSPVPAGQVSLHLGGSVPAAQRRTAEAWADTAGRIMKTLGIKHRLIVIAAKTGTVTTMRQQFQASTDVWSGFVNDTDFSSGFMARNHLGDVLLWLPTDKAEQHFYHTWAHEFGHALSYWALSGLDVKHQAQIYAAYRRHVLVYRKGKNPAHQQMRGTAFTNPFTPDDYYKSFEEWFAEQVGRWGTTSAKPLGRVARFFRQVAKDIIYALRQFRKAWGDDARAEPVIQDWLDAVYSGNTKWSVGVRETLVEKTRAANMKHGVNIPLQAESVKATQVLDALHGAAPPANAGTPANHTPGAIRAQLDKFNWIMKWGFGYHQVAQENMHIPEVQFYTEGMRMSRLDVNNIMAEAENILKQFMRPLRALKTAGKTQSVRLADFLFDMTEMKYRTTDEVNKGIRRNPTQAEFQALVLKHKLSPEAITAYEQIRDFFVKAVLRGEEVAIMEARSVFANDPAQMQVQIATAQMMTRRMLNAPYFPMTRFGEWAVTIRNATGGVERFETFESKREQQEAFREAMRQYPEAAGWSVRASVLPDDIKGFAGMPPWFLDRLQTMPGMTPQQVEWIKLLRYQVAPARSFRKHLLPRKKTVGYSRDMERVFARYAFQHARNYGRIKYQRFLESQIKSLRGEVFQPGHGDVNKRSQMANFLKDHFEEVMNPSSDWHMLRSVTSVWYLGMVPSSAALNMTQSILMTTPFLGSKFGDAKAMKAMTKAGGQISNFYKRGTYEGQTAAHMRMLDFLIKRGDVTESMAAELAGLASGNALDSYFGFGEKAQRGWLAFADKAMLMFKMVEQWNRRVAARATFELAMGDPNNEYVQSMKNKYFLQYQKMLQEGFGTETEILATLAAGDSIVSTHYDYSKEARPRFMRGKAGLLFAFYMFTQNTVFQLTSRENKGLFIRYALIMTLLAGPMGLLPDEGEDILEFIGKKYFGKDFHLKLEARRLVNELTDDEKMTDLLLHGTGRYSFGIPALMEALGGPSTPEIDFARLVELRGLAPLPITAGLDVIGGRGVNTEKMISRWTQDIAGAAFGLPFVWAQALGDSELDASDPKRWERAVPRALGKVMGAWRRYSEEGHRVGRSNYVLEYDTSDPADVAEIIAQGMGFTPTREALNWDVSSAKMEVSTFWKSKRQALLARAYEAKLGKWKNEEMWQEAKRAIQDFNKEAPDPSLRITMDTMRQSFRARQRTAHEFLHGEGPNIPPLMGKDISSQFPDTKRVGEQKVRLGFPSRASE